MNNLNLVLIAIASLVLILNGEPLGRNYMPYKDPNVLPGRTTYVHLFEWKWKDIALECERFLGPYGYGAVQISPPQEHAVYQGHPFQPWWQRYQPVSYKLVSRSGNEDELRDMIERCNAAGVRIYADAIINHVSREDGTGSAGSWFSASTKSFPEIPYGPNDFNDRKCRTWSGGIENYNDPSQVRECRLDRMPDLDHSSEYVRNKIADYLNSLIDLGVAGFRIDAAKHMWPGNLREIFNRLKDLRSDVFGPNKRPFIYQEVIDLGFEPIKASEYTGFSRVSEFKYGRDLSQVVYKRNYQRMAYLKNFGTGWSYLPDDDSIAFIDNHDNQRGHGAGGDILSHKNSRPYKIANAFMLAWPYAFTQVMSSYQFDMDKDWQGPPNNNGKTLDVIINDDMTCGNGWICEHRWRQIYNMVRFRNECNGEKVEHWWDNGYHQIAFSRGSKGFIAINNENFAMDVTLKTGLPSGLYCDVISGNKVNNTCTGRVINVNSDGSVKVEIKYYEEDPMIAIHIGSKL